MQKVPKFVTDPQPDQLYRKGSWVALDFETTNLEKGSALVPDNRIVLACWDSNLLPKPKHRWGSEFDMGELLADIEKADFIVAQNAKFELQWLARCGYDIGSRPVYDTMMAEWVLSGNRMWPLDLDSLSKKYGGTQKSLLIKLLMGGGISPELMPRSKLLSYCYEDLDNTVRIMHRQLEAMDGTRLLPIVYTRCLATIVLSDIEKNGICLDEEAVTDEYNKTLEEHAKLQQELAKVTNNINLSSPKQVAKFLYEDLQFEEVIDPFTGQPAKTDSGARKTDAATISALRATTPQQKEFVALKQRQGKLHAALSKNLEFFLGVCKEYGSVFYGAIRQGVARTHRLASSGRPLKFKMWPKPKSCQFQNLPNQYKKLIKARHEGWLVAEVDEAQLEFRVGGHLGRDSQILHDIINKEDIHSFTAKELTDAGEPTSRRDAKKTTFKPMFGGTKGSPAIEAYCEFFNKKYHELHSNQREWALCAANDKFIETEWGMRFYFNDVEVLRSGKIKGQQQVFNYPIQGFATGDIVPIGLVFFWFRTRGAKLIITNTVHDSITSEIPPDEIELFQLSAVQALTSDVYRYLEKCYGVTLTIPLGVSIKLGTHWSISSFTDEQLNELSEPLRKAGYTPVIDDGEISVDVPVQ